MFGILTRPASPVREKREIKEMGTREATSFFNEQHRSHHWPKRCSPSCMHHHHACMYVCMLMFILQKIWRRQVHECVLWWFATTCYNHISLKNQPFVCNFKRSRILDTALALLHSLSYIIQDICDLGRISTIR